MASGAIDDKKSSSSRTNKIVFTFQSPLIPLLRRGLNTLPAGLLRNEGRRAPNDFRAKVNGYSFEGVSLRTPAGHNQKGASRIRMR